MKLIILMAFGAAAFLAFLGAKDMDRKGQSQDTLIGGSVLVVGALVIAGLALVATILTFLLGNH